MRAVPLSSDSGFSYRRLLQGAFAGFIATAPMSMSMLVGWRLLARREKYYLPPRLITDEITERVGIEDRLDEKELAGLTILSHFGYGAVFGVMYALFEQQIPLRSSLKGRCLAWRSGWEVIWAGYRPWISCRRLPSSPGAGTW